MFGLARPKGYPDHTAMSLIVEKPKLLLDTRSPLGEGPLWDANRKVLWWVDILECLVQCYDPADGSNHTWNIGQMPGTLVLAQDGRLVLAAEKGFLYFDPETGATETIIDPEPDRPEHRFNDGKCDPAGRLWAGTMPICEEGNSGAIYCLHPDGHAEQMATDYAIPNGILWNADATTMYHIDSPTRRIDAWDFDHATGAIGNRRPLYHVTQEGAFPDGMAMDVEGKIWLALWGGWGVVRLDPETGEELARLELPVSQVSACAFGGPNLDELYITSARKNLSEEALEKQPHAGSLFKARLGVTGTEFTRFAG